MSDVISWDRVPTLAPMPGLKRRTVAATRSMLMRCDFAAGARVPQHEHPEEQMTIVLEGRLRMTAGDRSFEARAGDVVTVPAGVPHSAEALAPTVSIDVFTPVRPQLLPEQA